MIHSRSLFRTLACACAAVAGLSLTPVVAAQSDIEILKSYVGNWRGSGVTDASGEEETVRCKLDIKEAEGSKLNYDGRCALAGANLSIKGTIAFVEDKNRFEAVMSSNTSFSGVAVGRRRGNSVDFVLKDRNAESGDELIVDAGLELRSGKIHIDFAVTNTTTGKRITAQVPFDK